MRRTLPVFFAALLVLVAACSLRSRSLPPDPGESARTAVSPALPTWVKASDEPSEKKEHGPSGAMQALQYWGAQRAYPGRTIPDAGYGLAVNQARALARLETAAVDDEVAPWAPLGPANVGGRTLCLALHPGDPNILFAGSASGGLWKSTSGGVGADAWDYVETGYPVLGVSTIAINPSDPDVMYIGTGEGYDYQDSIGGEAIRTTRGSYGVGILKTSDGGATWSPSLDWTYQQSRGVWMIQIHPTNRDVLFAATTEGVYKSSDAGGSWTRVHDVVMAMDVRIHPVNPDIVFAAHGNFASPGHGIYRSTDGGAHWTKLTVGLPASWTGKAQLGIAPTVPDTIYASIANEGGGLGLYRSTNTGDSWTQVSAADYPTYQGWYSHYVVVSPFNPQVLYVGGIEIWRSINGGTTLTTQSRWTDVYLGTISPPEGPLGNQRYAHADHHFAVWHPTIAATIFFASDGGVFKTTNNGTTFVSLIGGYQTSQFYNGFSNSASDPSFAMGGLQDNFTVQYEGTNAWRRVIGGDGTWTAVNQQVNSTVYGSAQYLQLFRSTDSGINWSGVAPPDLAGDFTPFSAPYVLCPDQPSVMYAGRSRVYRSNNGGTAWAATNGSVPLSAGNPVMSLAVGKTSPDVAYAGTAPIAGRARVFTTRNGGTSWINITGSLPDRYPSDLTVDPNDASKVYATFMGFGTSHVFKSTDGGDSWIDIGGGLPDIPTSAIEVDPDDPDVLYVGTDLGIYLSINGGGSWQPFNNGMPLAMVNDLKVFRPGRKLRAATHGNGAWERDLYVACASGDTDTDGVCNADDCAPADPQAWQLPGEVTGLTVSRMGGAGWSALGWSAPADPGGTVMYDTIASEAPGDFVSDVSLRCVESNDGTDTSAIDTSVPAAGSVFYYLIRAEHACGGGPLGSDSLGAPRAAAPCPIPQ